MGKPILTISLLSSGRPDTLWKCLDSLKPIRDRLETELIIVDTGCSEDIRKRMEEYADQILPFTWINDFSAARNVGLKAASGEWFLYLDDDEWFIETEDIIRFFENGEYRDYDTAFYIQRNFSDRQGLQYEDAWVSRMKQIEADTHFTSSIHEYMVPSRKSPKLLHGIVEHYGYVFDTLEENREHSRRNIPLLLDMLKKEPEEYRWYYQLAQEYMATEEHEKAIETCDAALASIDRKKLVTMQEIHQIGFFYYVKAAAYLKLKQGKEGLKAAEEGLQDKRLTEYLRARLLSVCTQAYLDEGEYDACEKACLEYLKSYEKLADDEEEQFRQGSSCLRDTFTRNVHDLVCCVLIQCRLRKGDPSVLPEYFDCIGWQENVIYATAQALEDILEGLSSLSYQEYFRHVIGVLCERDHVHTALMEAYEKWRKTADDEKAERLSDLFKKVPVREDSSLYQKFTMADAMGDREKLMTSLKQILGVIPDPFELPEEYKEIANRHEVSMGDVIREMPFEEWKAFSYQYCEKALILAERRIELVKSLLPEGDVCGQCFEMIVHLMKVRKMVGEDADYADVRREIEQFRDAAYALYGPYYTDQAYTGQMEMLPEEMRAAVCLDQIMELEEEGKLSEIKNGVEMYARLVPFLRPVILGYLEKIARKKKEELEGGSSEERDEMAFLRSQLLLKAKQLEEAGNAEAAEMIRKQLEQY